MPMHLRVRAPFGDYARGDTITDPDLVARFRIGHEADHVVAFEADATPEPKAKG